MEGENYRLDWLSHLVLTIGGGALVQHDGVVIWTLVASMYLDLHFELTYWVFMIFF